ncbi:unnamed protein product [Aphanomyces euteiches]|uniref:Protein kinase domain-containing protein n=1 Tax=Aphanomyces euteiches TaxID=100861 RepID=A0A6G0XP72_9STRA|nr:hypothetical protein Ae201684_002852 [Aphanomyces euteiches]KAH9092997.1 hypothetical protein Ae201684P_008663 [Aphanomyces euteiches]KAH9146198.1 hypothetical protein AeRB84_009939 [Aphanomyces euteiches]
MRHKFPRWSLSALLVLLLVPVQAAVENITFTTSSSNSSTVKIQFPNGTVTQIGGGNSTRVFTLQKNWTIDHVLTLPSNPSNITLSGVGIRSLAPDLASDATGGSVAVVYLDLSVNKIKSIDSVHFASKMIYLNMSYNAIERIGTVNPRWQNDSPGNSLSSLYLDHNAIVSLQGAIFPDSLPTLYLSFNRLESIDNASFPIGLTNLMLDNNPISSIRTVKFPSALATLSLMNNNLTTFNADLLPPSITTLCLTGNPLTTVYASEGQFTVLNHLANPKRTQLGANNSCDSIFSTNLSTAACPNSYKLLWNAFPICIVAPPTPSPSPTSESSHNQTTISIIIAVACAVVVALALIYYCRRYSDKDLRKDVVPNDIRFDPLFKEHRIPMKELETESVIAAGGFGIVYRATYRPSGETVAMKQLLPEKTHDTYAVEVFFQEIRLVSLLRHPNIVNFVGIAFTNLNNVTLVTELLPRGDLWTWLDRDPRQFSWTGGVENPIRGATVSKLQIVIDVLSALSYLHDLQPLLLHRDLKARNILLTETWVAKLTDFGTSRAYSEGDATMTAEIGTIPWIAPEVLRGDRYNEKADIYSFGVLLSEMDTCVVPYSHLLPVDCTNAGLDATRLHIVQSVAAGKLRPEFDPECPEWLLKIARDCLAFDAKTRPSAIDLCAEFQRIQASLRIDTRIEEP